MFTIIGERGVLTTNSSFLEQISRVKAISVLADYFPTNNDLTPLLLISFSIRDKQDKLKNFEQQ